MPDTVTDPILRARLADVKRRLSNRLGEIDPHHRLAGRRVSYHVIAGQTIEVIYRDVPSIDESEVLGVKRLIGEECFCRVTPQTSETLCVRFVIPLRGVPGPDVKARSGDR